MIILLIIFLLLSLTTLAAAAYCSAVQDTVKHHFYRSIYYQPGNMKTKFGFNWNTWWASHWKNKWMLNDENEIIVDKNGKNVPRLTRFLFFKIQAVWFYDAWHHYKMLKIGFNIIADVMASITAIFIFITFSPVIFIWVLIALKYFLIQSVIWNITFNKYYDDWLLKDLVTKIKN